MHRFDYDEPDGGFADAEPALQSDQADKRGKGDRKKSLERINHEKAFAALYEAYMHPMTPLSAFREHCLLDDMFSLLCKLNWGWAYRKAENYKAAMFGVVDAEIALCVGCEYVYERLREDKAAGIWVDNPVAYYLKIARYKSIDNYFRKVFGRLTNDQQLPEEGREEKGRKMAPEVSLEGMQTNSDDEYHDDRLPIASWDPFSVLYRSRRERDDCANRLMEIYLRELMDYPSEPQKPLALMYGSVLFQLAKESDSTDPYAAEASGSKKVTSASWAHMRMGRATLAQLGKESQREVRKFYSRDLSWGSPFRQRMQERSGSGSAEKWADVVYTETYTENETTHWIESIMKSTIRKCVPQLMNDQELKEYAVEIMGYKTKFRKALEKIEKEAGR